MVLVPVVIHSPPVRQLLGASDLVVRGRSRSLLAVTALELVKVLDERVAAWLRHTGEPASFRDWVAEV